MSNDVCDRILSFMQSQAKDGINISVRTRLIADAADLTIYQVRPCLEILQEAGGGGENECRKRRARVVASGLSIVDSSCSVSGELAQGGDRNKDCGNMLMNLLKVIYYISVSLVVIMSLVFFISVFLLLKNE